MRTADKKQLPNNLRPQSRDLREAREIIELAHIWAPYGGVPVELTFQTFGMSRRQFVDKLWQAVRDTHCSYPVVRDLTPIYPRNGSSPHQPHVT
ncbi:hypothetical protein [Rhodococcus opacus]|uniref:hypothetical protein n=1 Tax=Rhodococcus opacus TaxID=37919 RepID=UPI001C47C001|nr:hypothetical protein [Rhodococcus opacus]MBV6763011.1 hypothetical protein [Rhodococcus opacus]